MTECKKEISANNIFLHAMDSFSKELQYRIASLSSFFFKSKALEGALNVTIRTN